MANEFPEATARFLYCVKCHSPQPHPRGRPTIQKRLTCSLCGVVTIHQNAESVFDAEELRAAAEAALPIVELYAKLLQDPSNRAPVEKVAAQLRAALHPQLEQEGK